MNKFKKLSKLFVLGALLSIQMAAFAAQHKVAHSDAEYQQSILFYINEYRAKHHLKPLVLKQDMSLEAAKHSRAMSNNAIPFGHTGFSGRIKRLYSKNKNSRGGAENVAYYRMDAKKLVDAWVASPGHRRNIQGNYNLTGIGIAHSKKDGWAYFTQIFLRCG